VAPPTPGRTPPRTSASAPAAWPGKQRVIGPRIFNVLDSQVRVLEQVRGLRIDLERVLPIEQVQVEPVVGHHLSVYYNQIRSVERVLIDRDDDRSIVVRRMPARCSVGLLNRTLSAW
jgi:hypothetical protein